MLHELDKELERRKLRYVRYADDFSIYTTSDQAARKAGNDICLFLKNKLKLPINREKSGIRKPVNFKILGFRFVSTYQKGERGPAEIRASPSQLTLVGRATRLPFRCILLWFYS